MVIDHSEFAYYNASFINLGDENIVGGGLYWQTSNMTVRNSYFEKDKAFVGGAIGVRCSPLTAICNTDIINTKSKQCSAKDSGGFYKFTRFRPNFSNNTFENNTAPYGNNIASYAIKMMINESLSQKIYLKDVAPG
jgi:hypothetical protein